MSEKQTYAPRAERIVTEQLKLPENLIGKKVLELFSGKDKNSLRQPIQERGGLYFSLDLFEEIQGHSHVIADAIKLPFKSNCFDHIVMNGPPFWGQYDEQSSQQSSQLSELTMPTLKESIRVLSEDTGSSIRISKGFNQEHLDYIKESRSRLSPNFDDNYEMVFEATDVPDIDKYGDDIPESVTSSFCIIKK